MSKHGSDFAMAEPVSTGGPLVSFQGVGMRYGRAPEVLRDIDLTLPQGSFHFLTGPSGAGKSSLLKLIYLAHEPSRGLIRLFDRDIATLPRAETPAIRRRMGVVFQDYRLLDHLTVFDNAALPLRIAGRPEGQIRADVGELLRWVGLGERMDALPPILSGGEKQRAAIARAVISRPHLLLADEPTGNLDERTGEKVFALLGDLRRKRNLTSILVTHNHRFARSCGRVLKLEGGVLCNL